MLIRMPFREGEGLVPRRDRRLSERPVRPRAEVPMPKMKHQELLKGLIRLHILHHASEAEFYGQWMIQELARHGYTLSPGTLYPMLHGMERRGYLTSKKQQNGRTFRRLYKATALGRQANRLAKVQVRELIGELQRSKSPKRSSRGRPARGAGVA
jgi:PadR family transcriptional regulator PadR